jgi:hypothetical protein
LIPLSVLGIRHIFVSSLSFYLLFVNTEVFDIIALAAILPFKTTLGISRQFGVDHQARCSSDGGL